LGVELAKPVIADRHIDMGAWWVTVSAPGSMLHGVFSRPENPQVLREGEWLAPGKAKGPPPEVVLKRGTIVTHQWGDILVVPREAADRYEHAFIRQNGLFLTSTDLKVFRDIRRIGQR
jgi:hypothetical protein